MLTKQELEAADKSHYVSGKEFTLNNGAIVMIPSMPIGTVSAKFIRMREAMGNPQYIAKQDDNGKPVFGEDGAHVMVQNPAWIDTSSAEGMAFFGKMLFAILQLNYSITLEQSDGLFSMNHFDKIVTWFFTGREDLDLSAKITQQERNTVPTGGETPVNGSAATSSKKNQELLG